MSRFNYFNNVKNTPSLRLAGVRVLVLVTLGTVCIAVLLRNIVIVLIVVTLHCEKRMYAVCIRNEWVLSNLDFPHVPAKHGCQRNKIRVSKNFIRLLVTASCIVIINFLTEHN
jgi:hypothetical protein